MKPTEQNERRVVIALVLVFLASAALVAWFRPSLVRFWAFTPADFVQLVTPLFLIALFIERVLEVFLTSWRAGESKKLQLAAKDQPKKLEAREATEDFKARTQRLAFLTGTAIGVVISALGIRILEPLLDPTAFSTGADAIPGWQQRLVMVADVLFTGAVLGGGSDGMHKLVQVFTNFMDSTAALAKKRGETPG